MSAATGVTAATAPTLVVAAKNVEKSPEGAQPSASLRYLAFGGAASADYYYRFSASNAAESTPVDGIVKYRNVRRQQIGGVFNEWGFSGNYARRNDLHWNGSAWTGCPDSSFQNTQTVRDANGRTVYNTCDGWEKGTSLRSVEDIAGKSLVDVILRIRAYPGAEYRPYSQWGAPLNGPAWTNAQIGNFWGGAVFPANSKLQFVTSVNTENAITYDPRDPENVVFLWDSAVAAGGDARSGGTTGAACAAVPTGSNPTIVATTLESVVNRNQGTPCRYNASAATAIYQASGSPNDWWSNSTVSVGTIGSEALGTAGLTLPAPYYTSNVPLRVAFNGGGTNGVTYYACQQRRSDGSVRNCTAIGTGSYAIATLGDARVLTFSGVPLQAATLTYERVFVERGGKVFFGYKNKPSTFNQIRLNLEAANAVLQKIGFPAIVP